MTENLIGTSVPVLDKGFIRLVDFMPHPLSGVSGDMAIVDAARVSFGGVSKGEAADQKLLRRLLRDQHTSPFEQVRFKFQIKAPLMTFWQLVRHRTFQYVQINSQSGRYTPFDEDEFYVPTSWRKQSSSNKQGSDGEIDSEFRGEMSDNLARFYADGISLYKAALDAGVAKEEARLFLPGFGAYYTWIMGVDALNLMNFLRLRMAADAQYEIRIYADAIYTSFFKPMLPWTAQFFEEFTLIPAGIIKKDQQS